VTGCRTRTPNPEKCEMLSRLSRQRVGGASRFWVKSSKRFRSGATDNSRASLAERLDSSNPWKLSSAPNLSRRSHK